MMALQTLKIGGRHTHEEISLSKTATVLGIHIDLRYMLVSVAPMRLWRLKQGLRWVLRCRALPGKTWELLLGHTTFVALLRRNALSVPFALNKFIRANYDDSRESVSKSRNRSQVQNASRAVPQLCERGKAGARRGRRGRRGNRAAPEHELQPRTTCERWRGPTGEASLLPTSVRKVGGTKSRSVVESSEGLEKESSDTIKTTIAKNDLVRSLLGDGEKQETFDGHPRPDVLPTWRTPATDAREPDQTNAWCGKGLVTAPPPRSTRRAEQNRELRRHDRLKKPKSPPGSPKWLQSWRPASKRIFEYRYEDFTREFRRATRALRLKDIVPYQCHHFWGVTGQSGTTPHLAGDQKTGKVEVRQQHCPLRKIWKTGADPVRSHQKSTNLLRSQRLSSRGACLWETPSRGRFTTLSDGGRLFLNLFFE